ncbi:UDP-N-acetylmuramate dehydrogenase [Flavobacteriaceae bacterium UJ101]|nr:UDP-N-acetylmuramate dehydrogenase [Flavobacteriaceae bacterium UJ101]
MDVKQNESLKNYNTFGIDVKSDYFIEIHNLEELEELFSSSKYQSLPRLILGGGSNILLTKDFEGIVIKLNLKGITEEKKDEDFVYVKAEAGENWHEFVQWNLDQNYGGLENMSLIPGNVGTAPMQNIGAYGVEIKDVFHELEAFEIATGKRKVFSLKECEFGYRESIFKNNLKGQYVIVSVTFKLTRQNHVIKKSYGAIQSELEKEKIQNPTIQEISKAVITIRKSKLPDPKQIGNSGSFFKNPIISKQHFETLQKKHPNLNSYPINEGEVKIAAGWLIDQAGWKGKRFGDAGVHSKQALVLVNYGEATGKNIYDLSQDIIEDIQTKFQIRLEREVNIL